MRKYMKDDSGYVLIGVIATFLVLSILSLTMISISAVSFKTSTSERDNQSAFYIAEAGLNYQEEQLKQRLLSIYESDLIETQEDFEYMAIGDAALSGESTYDKFEQSNTYAEIVVEQESPYEYTITSTGHIGGESRTLSKVINVEWQDKFEFLEEGQSGFAPPFAVFTSGSFLMNNGTIVGDIGTTNANPNSINFPGGGPTLNGNIYVPDGDESIVNNKVNNIKSSINTLPNNYTLPELPEFPIIPENHKIPEDLLIMDKGGYNSTYLVKDQKLLVNHWLLKNAEFTVDDNYYFQEIFINQNMNLTLNIGNKDRFIVVDHLNIENGNIYLEGSGSLTLFVKEKITANSGSHINKLHSVNDNKYDRASQLNVFYAGDNAVNLAGNVKVYGSMYIKKADIRFEGSMGVVGNIFSGGENFDISGGSKDNVAQIFFAPNAKFKITGGGAFKGRVIANHFEITGGATIEFTDLLDFNEGPISLSTISNNDSELEPGHGGNHVIKVPTNKNLIIINNPLHEISY